MTAVDVVILAVLLGLIPAVLAQRKGYSFVGWWLLGAAMFIVALPVVLLMKPNPAVRRPCPLCRSVIDAQARVCPQCGRDVFGYYAEHGQPTS